VVVPFFLFLIARLVGKVYQSKIAWEVAVDLEKLIALSLELIRMTACELAPDVKRALEEAKDKESGRAKSTLEWMLKNADEAQKSSIPICQDTGSLLFYVEHGKDIRPKMIREAIQKATQLATKNSYLRPNAVDPLSGANSGDNLGKGAPYIHFEEKGQDQALVVKLILKGGGSENCGVQYTLPDSRIEAGRDLKGIKKCILDAALNAQGFGCAPGFLGVGIGGDRMTSFLESKEQFFRKLDDQNQDPILAELENEMVEKINQLGIGPMGFGGKSTILAVKAGTRHRVPACFFVTVSYTCWAYRRRQMEIVDGQALYS
jgi:fumarate hydratase class I